MGKEYDANPFSFLHKIQILAATHLLKTKRLRQQKYVVQHLLISKPGLCCHPRIKITFWVPIKEAVRRFLSKKTNWLSCNKLAWLTQIFPNLWPLARLNHDVLLIKVSSLVYLIHCLNFDIDEFLFLGIPGVWKIS